MTNLSKHQIIADFPAYTIIHPRCFPHFETGLERVAQFQAEDVIGLPFESRNHGTLWRFFSFGSAVSYALAYCEDPITAYIDAVERGHATHWLNALPASVTAEEREKELRVGLDWGDVVVFEGRAFTLVKAPNNNVKLVPFE